MPGLGGTLRTRLEGARAQASAHRVTVRRQTGLARTLDAAGMDSGHAWQAVADAEAAAKVADAEAARWGGLLALTEEDRNE